jgi:hypothetical protein
VDRHEIQVAWFGSGGRVLLSARAVDGPRFSRTVHGIHRH